MRQNACASLKDTERVAECKAKRGNLAEKYGLGELLRSMAIRKNTCQTWDLANNWRKLVGCK